MERIETIIAKALDKVDNDRYKLSLIVSKRAEQLADGANVLVDLDKSKYKLSDIALAEIAEGKVTIEGLIETSR